MLLIQAIVLGLVQGLTEFAPVSSSAHLIIVPWLFGWNDPALNSLPFDVSLHLGTLLAVLAFFANDWARLIRAIVASLIDRRIGNDSDRRLGWLLIIGTIPGGIAGVLGESKIEELFHQPGVKPTAFAMIVMAAIIALLGLALWVAERVARHIRSTDALGSKDSILIGLAQALAIFPGVSRSGSTITAGLALGLKRPDAARFSFLLSAPIIAGAGLKSSLEIFGELKAGGISQAEIVVFPIGFVAAAISGYLCIRYLLLFLRRSSTDAFVHYRWALALLILIVAVVRG
jgi:undecaprenyl-diphosphatase